jgi:inositol phosphorylceramide mannosyltransferase catalytic subunit
MTVHFIWLGSHLPEKYWRNIVSYKKMGYNVEIHTQPFEDMYNKDIFDAMNTWAGKADVLRLEVLYRYGGLYCDVDSTIKRPFPSEGYDLVLMTTPNGFVGNETIYATKNHPAIRDAIELMKGNVLLLSDCNIWDIAGATFLTPILTKYPHKRLARSEVGQRIKNPLIIQHSYDASWNKGRKSDKKPLAYWLDKTKLV